jgi:hypothetical protein
MYRYAVSSRGIRMNQKATDIWAQPGATIIFLVLVFIITLASTYLRNPL